jgi:hypothetical protein
MTSWYLMRDFPRLSLAPAAIARHSKHVPQPAIAADERGRPPAGAAGMPQKRFWGAALKCRLYYLSSKNTEWVYFQGYPTLSVETSI